MRTLRRLLIVLLALWLPAANAWALLAPCAHAPHGAPDMSQAAEMPCHEQDADESVTPHAPCDCAQCHLSAAPVLPSTQSPDTAQAPATEHACVPLAHATFIPRLPLPPPVA